MIANTEKWSIVIIGYWNRMIFEPNWVAQLFKAPEVERLVSLVPIEPLVYRCENIILRVSEKHIVVNARKPTTECLDRAEQMALHILKDLPRTPVSGIGMNFAFDEEYPEDDFLELFNFNDDVDIGSFEWEIQEKTLTRKLVHNEKILNLMLSCNSNSRVQIHGNFHYDVDSTEQAISKIEGQTVKTYLESQFQN